MPTISRGTGVVVAQRDALADRIFARPVFRGHRLVDHDDGRRLLIVALGERAAADDLDPERREVVRADAEEDAESDVGIDARPSGTKPMPISLPVIGSVVATALAVTDGMARDLVMEPSIEGDHRCGVAIARLRQQQLHRDGALGPEPGTDALQHAQAYG